MKSIYLIGSLRNEKVVGLGKELRERGYEVFDDWMNAGPEADSFWQKYETDRGRTYSESLEGHHAKMVFNFDFHHLNRCDMAVLVLPAGKSAHLELGYARGCGKPALVLFDGEPEKWDMMYQMATILCFNKEQLFSVLEVLCLT